MEVELLKFFADNGITRDNPMTVRQYYSFVEQAGHVPTIGGFWNGINDFAQALADRGVQPKLRGMPRFRGGLAE